MPINTKELLDCLSSILDEENMKVTIKESGKGTLLCATACFVGGLLGGPVGLAVGGTVGGIGAAQMTKGKFKPVSQVIREMDVKQREILGQKLRFALSEIDVMDIFTLLALISGNYQVKQLLLKTAMEFVTNNLQLQIAGLLAGPIGLAVGGTVGGIGAAVLTKNTFKPVSHIIQNDLTVAQRETLAEKIMLIIREFHPADIATLLAILTNNRYIHEKVLQSVTNYLTNEMKLQIID